MYCNANECGKLRIGTLLLIYCVSLCVQTKFAKPLLFSIDLWRRDKSHKQICVRQKHTHSRLKHCAPLENDAGRLFGHLHSPSISERKAEE